MQKNGADWWDDLEDLENEVYIPVFQRKNQRLKDHRAYELEKEKYFPRKGSSRICRQKDGTDVRTDKDFKDVTSFTTNGKGVDVTSLKTNA